MNKEQEQLRKKSPVQIKNKKASFEYFFIETYTDRKLLLTKKEIRALESATKQTGYTIVPLLVFIDNKGRAKMDIALCKGKKEFDKRQTLKEKEDRREMDRAMKVYK